VGERRRGVVGGRRELCRAAVGERGQVLDGVPKRCERHASGLVRQRDVDLGPPGECLEQRPLGGRQVLEPVCEDRLGVPGVELALEPLGGAAPQHVAVPDAEPVELGAVGGVEDGEVAVEVARVDQPGLELAEDAEERVDEAAEAGRPRSLEPLGTQDAVDGPPGREHALGLREHRAPAAVARRDALEQVVERADRAAQEAPAPREQVPFDPVDVRPVRHDQKRLVVEARQIALEQQRDFARVRRPCDKGQPHRVIVRLPVDVLFAARAANGRSERGSVCGRSCARTPAAAGRRPARHFAGAVVAEVCDLGAAPGVCVGHAHRGTPVLANFASTLVTNEHSPAGHGNPPSRRN
jgi:hypothetical protein